MKHRTIWIIAAILGGLAITAGAFGSHILRENLSVKALGTFEIAVRYQMYHAIALLWIGSAVRNHAIPRIQAVALLWIAGVVLFCGSLYVVSLLGIRTFGMVAPIGGVAMIAGWLLLAIRIYQAKSE